MEGCGTPRPILHPIITKSQCCFFQLYWDIQLLNAGKQPTPADAGESFSIHSPVQDCVHKIPELNTCEKAHKQLDLGCEQSITLDRDRVEVCACRFFPLCVLYYQYMFFSSTDGDEGAVRECKGCEEHQESSQTLLGQVSILGSGLKVTKSISNYTF